MVLKAVSTKPKDSLHLLAKNAKLVENTLTGTRLHSSAGSAPDAYLSRVPKFGGAF